MFLSHFLSAASASVLRRRDRFKRLCSCDLARSGFFQKNGEYICTADYQRLYGTKCDSCGDFITGEVVSALGRTYHPKCFVCSVCRKPFPIGDRVTFSGKECVCQQCSHTLVSANEPIKIHGPSHCAGCKEEIKHGQSLLALEKQWHVSCFKCHTCVLPKPSGLELSSPVRVELEEDQRKRSHWDSIWMGFSWQQWSVGTGA
ncbi:hypothetical protein JZ751_007106 [Albula glossodonta]|uniref:LIM zinc-binding domain-containing protein n=1 Tax=Albula glossodonta TaxID=121402 RepID=A0A8T2PDH2_9TELE|nr:hypothetical protein JZ751_007106 [Albula glossodonta]